MDDLVLGIIIGTAQVEIGGIICWWEVRVDIDRAFMPITITVKVTFKMKALVVDIIITMYFVIIWNSVTVAFKITTAPAVDITITRKEFQFFEVTDSF